MSSQSYTLGMCELWWGTGVHDSSNLKQFRHLGNIVAGEIAPDISYLDHYKSVEGDRRKDKTVAITKAVSVPFTFDEISIDNINDFLYSLEITGAKSSVLQKVSVPVEGRAILRLKTNVGQSFIYTIPKCSLKAEGGLAFDAEKWMEGKFTLEVLTTPSYVVPDATSSAAPYGYLETDLSASTVINACESGWVKGPKTSAASVVVSNTATQAFKGTYSTKIKVATYWNYTTASGVAGMNCLAYTTITATNITPFSFLEFSLRASKDFSASTLYLGVTSTATPTGVPLDYIAMNALSTAKQWETQTIPIRSRGAGLTVVKCIAVYGSSKIKSTLATSVQTVWIDNVRCVK